MQLDSLTVDPSEAETAFRHYQAAVRKDRQGVRSAWRREDEALRKLYKALSKSQRVINLAEVMTKGGLGEDGLPKLAVFRSHAPVCFCEVNYSGSVRFSDLPSDTYRMKREHYLDFPKNTFGANTRRQHGKTMVPMIPPQLRPKDNLAHYYTLWEVDKWELLPPRDPALLKQITGWFFAVLAVWDLTELERSVLGIRAHSLR